LTFTRSEIQDCLTPNAKVCDLEEHHPILMLPIKTKLVNFGIKQKIRKEVSTTTKTYFLLSHFQLGGKGFMTQSFQA